MLPRFFDRTPKMFVKLLMLNQRIVHNPILLTVFAAPILLSAILSLIIYLRDRRWVNQRRDELNHFSV